MAGETESGASDSASYAAMLLDPRFLSIAMVSGIGVFGNTVVSPALPRIAEVFAVSEARVGLVVTAFFLPLIVMVPAVGVLADMYGRRRFIVGGLLLFGGAGVAIAAAGSFRGLLLLRAVQGVGMAGLTPLMVAVTGDLYRGPAGSTAQGVRLSANSLTQGIVPAVAGFLVGIGWRYPFLLYAAAFVAVAVVWVYLPETGRREPASGSPAEALREYWTALRAGIDPPLLLLMAGGFAVFFVRVAIITFVPLYAVRGLGSTAFVAGALISVIGLSQLVTGPFAGPVLARVPQRTALVSTAGLAAAGPLAIPFAPSVAWLGLAVAGYGVGFVLFNAILNDVVVREATDANRAGIVSGLNVLRMLASMLSPAVLGVVLGLYGFGSVFAVAGLLMLSYAAGLRLLG